DLVEIDRVGRAQDLELLAGHGTWAADRQAWARERMAPDEVVRQAEFLAEYADFVLEELAQRLDQLHFHALGQATHIVMRFDRDRRTAGERNAFDHVRVERALHQEVGAAELLGFFLEHFDEEAANGLALL